MNTQKPQIPITTQELEEVKKDASYLVGELSKKTDFEHKKVKTPSSIPLTTVSTDLRREKKVSFKDMLNHVSEDEILSDDSHLLISRVRKGLQIALHVSNLYKKASGIDSVDRKNMSGSQKGSYNEKMRTASAIAQFVCAQYVVWAIEEAYPDLQSDMQRELVNLWESNFSGPTAGLKNMMFYLSLNLSHPVIAGDKMMIGMVLEYMKLIRESVEERIASFQYSEIFTDNGYLLENSTFAINGFERTVHVGTSVEFNKVEMEQIVGNRDAKHFARRLVERLLAYDFTTKQNPFDALGGISPVHMGYGIAGTGKSMLISAIATLLEKRCKDLEIPFLFHPLPDTVVSTFQGGSAEHMVRWMKPLQDPSKIIFAPIDDAENNLQDRTMQGISAGVREIIGVFLRYTEGAYAINHGNAAVGVYTNLPEQIDPAVLSRIQSRFKIDGARSVNDILDQDYLWWSKLEEVVPGFVGMKSPAYSFLSDQAVVSNMGDTYGSMDRPVEESILDAFEAALEVGSPKEHAFFAKWYKNVQKVFPGFSSRDIRNIQKAVSYRIMDFDLPDEWYENPEAFFRKDYDTKLTMIQDSMKQNMGSLNFAEVRLQESIRYLDNYATIADANFKRRVGERVEQLRIAQAANDAFANEKESA